VNPSCFLTVPFYLLLILLPFCNTFINGAPYHSILSTFTYYYSSSNSTNDVLGFNTVQRRISSISLMLQHTLAYSLPIKKIFILIKSIPYTTIHCATIILRKQRKIAYLTRYKKSNYLMIGTFKIKKNAYPKRIGISTIKTVYLLFSK
jgi:hypothetical protein